jgi:hypothetical protein
MNSLNTVGSDLEPDPEEIDPGVRMYESADHVSNTVAVFIGGTFFSVCTRRRFSGQQARHDSESEADDLPGMLTGR